MWLYLVFVYIISLFVNTLKFDWTFACLLTKHRNTCATHSLISYKFEIANDDKPILWFCPPGNKNRKRWIHESFPFKSVKEFSKPFQNLLSFLTALALSSIPYLIFFYIALTLNQPHKVNNFMPRFYLLEPWTTPHFGAQTCYFLLKLWPPSWACNITQNSVMFTL